MLNDIARGMTKVLLVSALVGTSCSDPEPLGDDCFPWDPWVDERAALAEYAEREDFRPDEYDRMSREIGFCEYGPEEKWGIFPEHDDLPVELTGYCQAAESCEQCVGEEIDERIREAYSAMQDMAGCPAEPRSILAYERGCVTPYEDDDGVSWCCYSAAVVSECPLNSVPSG